MLCCLKEAEDARPDSPPGHTRGFCVHSPCSWRKSSFCKESERHCPLLVFMFVLNFNLCTALPHQATSQTLFWPVQGWKPAVTSSLTVAIVPPSPIVYVFAPHHSQLRLLSDVTSSCPIVSMSPLMYDCSPPCRSVCGLVGCGVGGHGSVCGGLGYTECMWSFMANHMCFWIFELPHFFPGWGFGES